MDLLNSPLRRFHWTPRWGLVTLQRVPRKVPRGLRETGNDDPWKNAKNKHGGIFENKKPYAKNHTQKWERY